MKKTLKKLNFSPFITSSAKKSFSSNAINQSSYDFILLVQKWPEIIGPVLKEHTYPKSLKNGSLTLMVRHAVFASELKSLSPIIIKKIVSLYPSFENHIKTIKFVTSELFFENLKAKNNSHKKEVQKPNDYDPNYAQKKHEAEKIFDHLDDETKKLFISLYTQK